MEECTVVMHGGTNGAVQGVGCHNRGPGRRVGAGGVWPVGASCVQVDGAKRWVLDELPAELSEQAHMRLWEQGVDGGDTRRQEWSCGRALGGVVVQWRNS